MSPWAAFCSGVLPINSQTDSKLVPADAFSPLPKMQAARSSELVRIKCGRLRNILRIRDTRVTCGLGGRQTVGIVPPSMTYSVAAFPERFDEELRCSIGDLVRLGARRSIHHHKPRRSVARCRKFMPFEGSGLVGHSRLGDEIVRRKGTASRRL